MDINIPTPLTDEEYAELQIQHEKERQKRLLTYDNTTVLAKLHYYKGTIAVASTDSITHKQFADVVTGWNSVVMVGTQRQMCADDTIDNITGTYTINLTDKMLKAYNENNNQLLIIK